MKVSSGIAAVLLAALFCFTGLANHPLRASDETRVAGIGWEMAHTASAGPLPTLGAEPFLEHPPLFYAVLGGFLRVLGAHEGVARLPGALASFLCLLLVFDLGRRVATPRAGIYGMLALVGMGGFFRYSHKVLVDPLLMSFVLLGFHAYVRTAFGASRDGGGAGGSGRVSSAGILAIHLAACFAFYTKGPIGIVAIGGPIALDVLVFHRWALLQSPAHIGGVLLLLGVCASWPLMLYASGGSAALQEFVLQNGLYRILPGVAADAYHGGHEGPFWFYLVRIPGQLLWVFPLALGLAAWVRRGDVPEGWNRDAIRFLALVFPAGLILLSIPGTKRGLYLLPFLPPLAVAVGAWVEAVALPDARRSRLEAGVAKAYARLVAGLHRPVAALLPGSGALPGSSEDWKERLRRDVGNAATGPCHALQRSAWIGFAVAVAWNVVGFPLFEDHGRDLGPMSREIAARFGEAPVVGYMLTEEMRGALPFYTGRVARNLKSAAALAAYGREHPDAQVLSFSTSVPIRDEAGRPFAVVETWDLAEGGYTLYTTPAHPTETARADR